MNTPDSTAAPIDEDDFPTGSHHETPRLSENDLVVANVFRSLLKEELAPIVTAVNELVAQNERVRQLEEWRTSKDAEDVIRDRRIKRIEEHLGIAAE